MVNRTISGCSSNNKYWSAYAPLDFAIHFVQPEAVKILLERGAIPNKFALHKACGQSMVDVETLIKRAIEESLYRVAAVDGNISEDVCDSVLMLTRRFLNNRFSLVKILTETCSIDINERDLTNETALGYAIKSDFHNIPQIFKRSFFEYTSQDVKLLTADFATARSNIVNHLLLNSAKINERQFDIASGLIAEENNVRLLELFLNKGIDPNSALSNAPTFLHKLMDSYDVEDSYCDGSLIDTLVDYGADVNLTDEEWATPLHVAVKRGHLRSVQSLLSCRSIADKMDRRVNVNAQDIFGNTALHYACLCANSWEDYEDLNLGELLFDFGCDINVENNDGLTPLSFLYFNYFPESVDYTQFLTRPRKYYIHQYNYIESSCFTERSECLNCLRDLWIKLKVAGYYVSKKNQNYFEEFERKFDWFSDTSVPGFRQSDYYFTSRLKREIELMKSKKLDPHNNLHSFLSKPINDLNNIVQNVELKRILEEKNFGIKFSLFGEDLRSKFISALARKKLLIETKNILFVIPKHAELPELCWEKILSFFSDIDLKRFIQHASPWNSAMGIKRKVCPDESEFCQDAKRPKISFQ